MKVKIIVALVVVAVLLVGGYMYMTKKAAPTVDTSSNTETTPTTGKKIAFSELVKQNKSLQCTVHEWVGDTDNLWTVYTDQGLVRAEFGTVTTIVRDGYAYNWNTSSPKTGSKVVSSLSEVEANQPAPTADAFNVFLTGDYSCETAVVDATKFELPTKVTFTEAKATQTSNTSTSDSSSNGLMKPADDSGDAVVCTADAKECPDGSFVGRSGPKCAFAPCPGN